LGNPRKPIERRPKLPVPMHWGVMQGGRPYRPLDTPSQEDWGTVAEAFYIDVADLIFFNFMTHDPDEVNWYLHWHVGCEKVSPSGNNFMFSKKARPGLIFIPPAEDKSFDYDKEHICSWSPNLETKFIRTLDALVKAMPSNNRGKRIKRLMQVIVNAGYPRWKDLWYYNDMVIQAFVDWKTDSSQLRKSTEATKQTVPFDGQSVWHDQSDTEAGGSERQMGMWRIHAIKKMFDDFCTDWDVVAMKQRLVAIDAEMYKGWYELSLIDFRTHHGGGSAYNELVEQFNDHVVKLAKDKTHLYWAFG
jgi:hypothetical protein